MDFIRLCNKYGVQYLVIGGYAVNVHGYVRYTKDLDVAIAVAPDNAVRMMEVIHAFGFGSLGLQPQDFLQKNGVVQLGHAPVRIDILNDVDGISFSEAFEKRKDVLYEDVLIHVIGLDELYILKQRAGRKQDLADIEKLQNRNRKK